VADSARYARTVITPAPVICGADGTSLDVETVIWATGYRSDYSWIHMPGVTHGGQVIHRRGVTDVPGLPSPGIRAGLEAQGAGSSRNQRRG
jgi:hypothetical protein